MAKAAFLINDLSRSATVTYASPTITGLGWDQLKDPQPRHRARVNDSSAYFVLDLGAEVMVDCVALIGTSLDASATVKFKTSTIDPEALTFIYSPNAASGVTSPDWNGNVIMTFDVDWVAPIPVRYLRWEIQGVSGPIDIGLAPVGAMFRPTRNFSFGSQEGRSDASIRDINPDTGAEFGLALPGKRIKTLNFPALTKAEARGPVDEMDRLVGASGDVLFVEDPQASRADCARDSIWGSFRKTGADAIATRSAVNMFGRQFVLTERL